AGARDLVRRLELEPDPLRVSQARERGRRLAVGERDRALDVRDDRVQHRALVLIREPAQLGAGAARLPGVAAGELDLHPGREQRGPLERCRDLRARSADRRERGAVPALREAKLGETGLRLPAVPARVAVGLLGRRELAAQPQELALAVEREPGGAVLRLD